MIYLLDTNALVWHISDSPRLSRTARLILDNLADDDQLVVPTIVLAETWDLARKQRRDFVPFNQVMQLIRAGNTRVMSLDLYLMERLEDPALDVLRQWPRLWTDIHDMIVVAAALLLQDSQEDTVSIISGDDEMRDQPLIPCLW